MEEKIHLNNREWKLKIFNVSLVHNFHSLLD